MKNRKYTVQLPFSAEEELLVEEIVETERMMEQHQLMVEQLRKKAEILTNIRTKLSIRDKR